MYRSKFIQTHELLRSCCEKTKLLVGRLDKMQSLIVLGFFLSSWIDTEEVHS